MKISKEILYDYVFALLCFSLPFEGRLRFVPNFLLIVMGLMFFFIVKKEQLLKLKSRMFLVPLSFLIYVFLVVFLGQDSIHNNISFIKKVALIPVVYIVALAVNDIVKAKVFFIAGLAVSVLISYVNLVSNYMTNSDFNISFGNLITELLVTERVYIGFMCVLSFIWSLELLEKNKKLMILNIAMIVCFVFLIGARISIISIILISLLKIIGNYNYKKAVMIVAGGVLFIVSFFALNPSLQERFFHSHQKGTLVQRIKGWEHRFQIWECAYGMFKNGKDESRNHTFGYQSFNITNNRLLDCYKSIPNDEIKRNYYVSTKFNTHNQFVDILLSSGFVGLTIFTFIFISGFSFKGNTFNNFLLITVILLAMVENFMYRQIGVYLFGLILTVIATNKIKEKPPNG